MDNTRIGAALRRRIHRRIIVRTNTADSVAREKSALRETVSTLKRVLRYNRIRLSVITRDISCRHEDFAWSNGKFTILRNEIVVLCTPLSELHRRNACPKTGRPRIRRDRRRRIDHLRHRGNRIAAHKSRRRIRCTHVDASRTVHIRGE